MANARAMAHHEAAHAAALFLLGQVNDIVHINMRGTTELKAHLRWRSPYWAIFLLNPENAHEPLLSCDCLGFLFFSLMGPAAEARSTGTNGWLDNLVEADGWECIEDDGSDIGDAWKIAIGMAGSERGAERIIRRVARWCDELAAEGRVWQLITDLVEELPYGKRMLGTTIARLLRQSWGVNDRVPPFVTLGYKWRRRFKRTVPNTIEDQVATLPASA